MPVPERSRSRNRRSCHLEADLGVSDEEFIESLDLEDSDNSHCTWKGSHSAARKAVSDGAHGLELRDPFEQSDSITIISDVQSRASRNSVSNSPMMISRPQHASSQQEKLVALQVKKKSHYRGQNSGRRIKQEVARRIVDTNKEQPPSWALELLANEDSSVDNFTFYSKQSSKTKEMMSKQLGELRRDSFACATMTQNSDADSDSVSTPSRSTSNDNPTSSNDNFTSSNYSVSFSSTVAVDSQASFSGGSSSRSETSYYSGDRGRSKVRQKSPVPNPLSAGGNSSTAATYKHPTTPARLDFRSEGAAKMTERPSPPPMDSMEDDVSEKTAVKEAQGETEHKEEAEVFEDASVSLESSDQLKIQDQLDVRDDKNENSNEESMLNPEEKFFNSGDGHIGSESSKHDAAGESQSNDDGKIESMLVAIHDVKAHERQSPSRGRAPQPHHMDPIQWIQTNPKPLLLLEAAHPSSLGASLQVPSTPKQPYRTALPDLHAALQRGASLCELYKLAAAAKAEDPPILEHRDAQGNTPLHIACMESRHRAAAALVQWWNPISQATTKTTITNTPKKECLLANEPTTQHHPYYDGDSLLLIIQLLYNLCPKNIKRANNDGNLPLHLAILSANATIKTTKCDYQTNSVLSHSESASVTTNTTTLSTSEVWLEIIEKLVAEFPFALHLPNKLGQVPLDLAIHKMGVCPEIVGLIQDEIRLLGHNSSSLDGNTTTVTQFSSSTEQSLFRRLFFCGVLTGMPSNAQRRPQALVDPNTSGQRTSLGLSRRSSSPIFLERCKHPLSTVSSTFKPIRGCQADGSCSLKQPIWQFANSKMGFFIALLLVFAGLVLLPRSGTHRPIRVAFVGNSITFVNDLPRFMEALSQGYISQDSCLHGATRLRTILNTGNGMYNKWQTDNAFLKEVTMDDDLYQYVPQDDDAAVYGEPHNLYDFGACTVEQLLLGTDPYLVAYNENGHYREDGKNACFQDQVYFRYRQQQYLEMTHTHRLKHRQEEHTSLAGWDYVVLNDQTLVPAIEDERELSEQVLKYVYAPYFKQINARPVLLMTHAYSSNASVNFDEDFLYLWEDVPAFTSALYQGYHRYVESLKVALPSQEPPLLAPAGLAYLVIWEENVRMWERLFFVDGFHPTPHGTFLIGCVLYATLYNKMPANIPVDVEVLWARARRMQIGTEENTMPIPTRDEAIYLAKVAERVVLRNYMPKSYIEDLSSL